MAKSKTEQAKAAIPYARRVVEDRYAQEQLQNAAARLREVYGRASREGTKATEDKHVYAKVREAATSIRNAIGAIEEPPPPKRRGRKLLALAGIAALAAFLLKQKSNSSQPNATRQPDGDAHVHGESAPTSETMASEPVA